MAQVLESKAALEGTERGRTLIKQIISKAQHERLAIMKRETESKVKANYRH